MPFKADAFRNAKFEYRTATLDERAIPGLKGWFEGEVAWVVRGLTFDEIRKCQEISTAGSDIVAMLAKAVSDPKKGRNADAIRQALGFGGDVHKETRLRIEHLVTCSVDPAIDNQIAAQLQKAFPMEFRVITDKILELTGLGQIQAGESKASGRTTKSESDSHSPPTEADSSTSASPTDSRMDS